MYKCKNVQMYNYSNVQMYKCTNTNKCKNTHSTWYFQSEKQAKYTIKRTIRQKNLLKACYQIKSFIRAKIRQKTWLCFDPHRTHPPPGQVQKVWRLWPGGVVREKVINLTACLKNAIFNKIGTDHGEFLEENAKPHLSIVTELFCGLWQEHFMQIMPNLLFFYDGNPLRKNHWG